MRSAASRAALIAALVVAPVVAPACSRPYRVGDYVWVEWDGQSYPAYIVDVKGSRFRVHFDGYEQRWDDDVTLERIKGQIEAPVPSSQLPPPPARVARLLPASVRAASSSSGAAPAGPVASPYKVGDRLRVRWRESIYTATVTEVPSASRVRVHYEGHENAWDETVDVERVIGRR